MVSNFGPLNIALHPYYAHETVACVTVSYTLVHSGYVFIYVISSVIGV